MDLQQNQNADFLEDLWIFSSKSVLCGLALKRVVLTFKKIIKHYTPVIRHTQLAESLKVLSADSLWKPY